MSAAPTAGRCGGLVGRCADSCRRLLVWQQISRHPADPRQALLAAATHTQQITSATETLTVLHSGAANSTTTGTIRIRLKPTLLISGNLSTTAAGTSTQVKVIVADTAIYLNEASLTSQVGKPWVQIDLSTLSALAGTGGAGLAQLFHSLETNSFTNRAQLFTVAKNARVVGKQTVDGVSTTDYAGSFIAADGLKALPADFREALAPELQALGNSTVYFHEWIDGQDRLRKMTAVETLNGDTVNTTINITAINQPVSITLPPASQTFTLQGGRPASAKSGNGGLGGKVVPAPPGFAPSQAAAVPNGPIGATDFNQIMGGGIRPPAFILCAATTSPTTAPATVTVSRCSCSSSPPQRTRPSSRRALCLSHRASRKPIPSSPELSTTTRRPPSRACTTMA